MFRRSAILIVLAVITCVDSRPAFGQVQPLTNNAILQMLDWKLKAKEINAVIKRNPDANFVLTTENLTQLTAAHVPQSVLEAMAKAMVKSSQQIPQKPAPKNDAAKSDAAKSDATDSNSANRDVTKSDTKSESGKTNTTSDNGQADATKTDVQKADTTKTDAANTKVKTDTAQTDGTKTDAGNGGAENNNAQPDAAKTKTDNANTDPVQVIKKLADERDQVKTALAGEDSEFGLVLGVGSLILRDEDVDYQNQSNVLHATNLGRATPQLMAGVSFRTKIPSLLPRYRQLRSCTSSEKLEDTKKTCGEIWQTRPWNAFVSLKFAPGASQTLNGFVFGGTYAVASHFDLLIGFALTPINEPAPGFRAAAAQFVRTQQAQGKDLNFNPTAMLNNDPNAFDGFPVTDASSALIYQGNPTTVHYRNGFVLGISIPIYFKSLF